jgi:hypothetical protein
MGRIYGSNRIIGTVGGLRHYQMNNDNVIYVAEKGGANIDLIMNNPAFDNTRRLMSEMKPRAFLAKDIKRNLGQWSVPIVNRYLIGAINAALRKAQKKDTESEKGTKSIILSKYKDVLNLPTYYWEKSLRDILKCPYSVETGIDRKSITLSFTDFIPREQLKSPPEATHFQLCLCIGVVCDYVYIPEHRMFEPVYSGTQMMCSMKEMESEWIPVKEKQPGDLTFTVALPDSFQLEDDMTVIRCIGIVFGKNTYDMESLKYNRGSIEFLGAI